MWGLKTITVPVVIGALGVFKKGIEKHFDKIPGKINFKRSPSSDQATSSEKFYRSNDDHDYPLEPQTLEKHLHHPRSIHLHFGKSCVLYVLPQMLPSLHRRNCFFFLLLLLFFFFSFILFLYLLIFFFFFFFFLMGKCCGFCQRGRETGLGTFSFTPFPCVLKRTLYGLRLAAITTVTGNCV